MRGTFIIAWKELRLLFKSIRRILLLFSMSIVIIFIGILFGLLLIFSSPSVQESSIVFVYNEDRGIYSNSLIDGIQTRHADSIQLSLIYTPSDYQDRLASNDFKVLVYIPTNFTELIHNNQTATLYIHYDNNEVENEMVVSIFALEVAILNNQIIDSQYGEIKLNWVAMDISGTSTGSGAIIASILSLIPMYAILFFVMPPIMLTLISITMEREQQTLETVLLQPIERVEFVLGKILYGIYLIAITAVINLLAIGFDVLLLYQISGSVKQSTSEEDLIPSDFDLINLVLENIDVLTYVLVGILITSCLMVVLSVLLSLLAKDEREGNQFVGMLISIPMIVMLLTTFIPVAKFPEIFLVVLGAIPFLGYLISVYLIILYGTITWINILSLFFQILWIFAIIWIATRIVESEGILDISYSSLFKSLFKH